MFIVHTNAKSKGSYIVNLDSVRGCKNNCESCFAKRNSSRSIKYYDKPVLVRTLYGKADPNKYYRFGNFGDPATDWRHTEELINKYKIKNNFVVTKLQTIENFTGFIKNLQVSVDPLKKEHFFITLRNVKILLNSPIETNIVLRVRSVATFDKKINKLQRIAVEFSNKYNLPILETRVRFVTKEESIRKYKLDSSKYFYRAGYLRPNYGTRFLKNVKKHYICDEKELKCKGCNNCIRLLKKVNVRTPLISQKEKNLHVT